LQRDRDAARAALPWPTRGCRRHPIFITKNTKKAKDTKGFGVGVKATW
jgi:hypothetical protein